MRTSSLSTAGGFAGFLACRIGGIRVAFDNPENLGGQVLERLNATHVETKGLLTRAGERIGATETAVGEVQGALAGLGERIAEVEQKTARRGGGGGSSLEVKSWGQRFVESDEYKASAGSRDRQGRRIHAQVATSEIEHKNVTTVTGSGGALIPADRRVGDAAMLPWATNTVRDLCAPGTTEAGAVVYPRMLSRTNAAAMVGETLVKPKSDMQFEEVTAPVRTLAHMFICSRQVMDDAPALRAIIDAEARAGLADAEDSQLLFGDGTGQNLQGLVPMASPFAKQWTVGVATPLDVLIQAIAQCEAQNFKVDGLVLNAVDWRRLQSIKDTNGKYLGNSPFEADIAQRIWSTAVSATTRMPPGTFLLGPFRTQAQIFDRLGVEILLSTEHANLFELNMIAIRAEERLAFTCRRPSSFIAGSLTASLT